MQQLTNDCEVLTVKSYHMSYDIWGGTKDRKKNLLNAAIRPASTQQVYNIIVTVFVSECIYVG